MQIYYFFLRLARKWEEKITQNEGVAGGGREGCMHIFEVRRRAEGDKKKGGEAGMSLI